MKRALLAVRDYLLGVDLLLWVLCALCAAGGIFLVRSATLTLGSERYILIQTAAAAVGAAAFLIASLIPDRWLYRLWIPLLILNIALQITPRFFASFQSGNRSWIRLPYFSFQPGELGKVIFIVTFAAHLRLLQDRLNTALSVLQLLAHWGILTACVMVFSRDDGMALQYIFIGLSMLFAAGLAWRWFAAGALTAAVAAPLIWRFFMDPYQRLRILVIFDPTLDPDKAYQANQTRRAIGGGLFTGQGYMQGNLTQRSLIPTKHTDSIFAVAGEEFGFVGAMAVLVLLTLVILRCLYLAARARNTFDSTLCAGLAGMLIFQTVVNIGMNIGLLPVIGLTLPFFSYGGTSLVTMFGSMGLAAGVRLRISRQNDELRALIDDLPY